MDPLFTRTGDCSQPGASLIPTPHRGIFLTLFFTIFTTITGVGIVVPLLPVYAHDLGAAGVYVGLIFGSFSLSRTVLLPVFGRMSDRRGRKPFIVIGLAGHVLVSIAFIVSTSVSSLIAIRFVQGIVSAMIMPVVQAYVGEITPPGKEGYSMGMFNMSMFGSLSLGPLLGGVVRDAWSMGAAFACMGLLSGLGVILAMGFLPPVDREFIKHREHPPIPWRTLILDRHLMGLFVFRFVYVSCIGIIWCFLPLYAETRFSLSGSSTGILVSLGVFIGGILQVPMGYLADRISTRLMIGTGGVLCALAMAMLLAADSFSGLVWAVSVFGLGGGLSMPAVMALAVVTGNEKGGMGSVMSLMTVAHSLGMMAGSMAAGLAMDYFELEFVFPFGSGLMALGLVLFLAAGVKKTALVTALGQEDPK
ncbi:MAG: MFS transporter [Pseudomonadota bacterium]